MIQENRIYKKILFGAGFLIFLLPEISFSSPDWGGFKETSNKLLHCIYLDPYKFDFKSVTNPDEKNDSLKESPLVTRLFEYKYIGEKAPTRSYYWFSIKRPVSPSNPNTYIQEKLVHQSPANADSGNVNFLKQFYKNSGVIGVVQVVLGSVGLTNLPVGVWAFTLGNALSAGQNQIKKENIDLKTLVNTTKGSVYYVESVQRFPQESKDFFYRTLWYQNLDTKQSYLLWQESCPVN